MKITSVKNPLVKRYKELLRDKRLRDGEGSFIAEGDHLCFEAKRAGLEIKSVLATEKAMEKYRETFETLTQGTREYFVITNELSEYISDTKTPQGIFAEFGKAKEKEPEGDRLVILDGVQDPVNIGAVIRTSEALGIGGVIMLKGCADIYSPKTIRASMGSVFRTPCITADTPDIINVLKDKGYKVYASVLDENAERIDEAEFPVKAAVVIGSEGAGISEKVKNICQGSLYIPIKGAESLNAGAAAAIILWELNAGGRRNHKSEK